jgi:hypothetical protein
MTGYTPACQTSITRGVKKFKTTLSILQDLSNEHRIDSYMRLVPLKLFFVLINNLVVDHAICSTHLLHPIYCTIQLSWLNVYFFSGPLAYLTVNSWPH